jgi:putative peptidoglycan lipid II flippase
VGILVAVVMGVMVVAGILWAPTLVDLVTSSKASPETCHLAVKLSRIMLPAAFFMGLFYLAILILNTYKRFALPAMGDALNKLLVIVLLVLLCRTMGIKGLAFGVLVGAAAALALQVVGLRSKLALLKPAISFKDPTLRRFGWLLPPIVLSILIAQTRTILDYWFASDMGQGYAAGLNYARGLSDTLILIVPSAVGVAIYPFFSDLSAEGARTELMDSLMRSIRTMAFFFIPLSVLFLVLRTPLVQLAFQRGKFEAASVVLTSGPLLYYSIGLTFFAVEILLMRFYFSLKDTLTPTLVGVGCVLVHVAVVLVFRSSLQHQSMALAATVSKSVKVILLLLLLRSKMFTLPLSEITVFLLQSLVAAAAMGGVVWLVSREMSCLLSASSSTDSLMRTGLLAIQLGVSSVAGLAVFGILATAFRMEEARTVLRLLTRNRNRVVQN